MSRPAPTARRAAHETLLELGLEDRHARAFAAAYSDAHLPGHPARTPHRHPHLELLWLEDGAGELLLDLRRIPFHPRCLVFVAAGRVHAWDHHAPPRGTLLAVPQALLQGGHDEPGTLARFRFVQDSLSPVVRLDGADAEEIAWVFALALEESSRLSPDSDAVLRSLAILTLVKIRRVLASRGSTSDTDRPPCSPLVQRFQHLLEQHFTSHKRVYQYARMLGVSRTHLNEELVRETGRTASGHVAERVLLEAKRLLAHTSLPVAAVSAQLRFRDPSYFGRSFRLHTGMTPAAFRAAARDRAARGAA